MESQQGRIGKNKELLIWAKSLARQETGASLLAFL